MIKMVGKKKENKNFCTIFIHPSYNFVLYLISSFKSKSKYQLIMSFKIREAIFTVTFIFKLIKVL